MFINDLSAKIASLRGDIDQALARVLDRGKFVLGHEVKTFEENFAQYLGVPFCTTVANGTDALELALRAAGVKEGDRVGTVANAGFYASTAILALGAKSFYLDVDLETQLVSFDEVERALQADVKAIIVTHLYGKVIPEIKQIAARCSTSDVVLIEDCAQAHGAMLQGEKVGSFGDLGCFSFYPTKNLGALGDGGAIVCHDEALAKKLYQLRQYGWSSKYQVEIAGGRNSRLDEMQAALLNVFLPHLDQWNKERCEIAMRYSALIKHPHIKTPSHFGQDHVAHLYVIRCAQRDALSLYLKEQNIPTAIHYPIPDHHQPLFKNQFSQIQLPNTEKLAREVLTLPCYQEMSDEDVVSVVTVLNNWSNYSKER